MIYMFLADGFEEVEALAPLDILRRASLNIKTVGVTGEFVTGVHGITVKADTLIEEIDRNNENLELLQFFPNLLNPCFLLYSVAILSHSNPIK